MKKRLAIPPAVLTLFALYLSSRYNYLLFHTLAELFSIVIACGIFMTAWNARRYLNNGYLLFIGIAYLFIGGVDLLHTLSYKGMPIFPGYGANLPTQLWIGARYLESLSLLFAPLLIRRQIRAGWIFLAYSAVTLFLLLSIFTWNIFPACFIDGTGLTPFKKISEYVISLFLLASMGLLLRHREEFDRNVLLLLIWSIFLTIASELAFTFYVQVYGLSNLIGHYFKILSFFLIYKALIETGLARPYELLFRELSKAHDELELRVQERTAELGLINKALKDYAAKLERLNRELSEFAFAASHDLREPLRKIQTFGAILTDRFKDGLGDEGQDYLTRMTGAANRMSALIQSLLNYSRLNRPPEPFEPTDLSKVLSDTVTDLELLIRETGGTVAFGDMPVIEADAVQLRQLFQNLISNAMKFAETSRPPVVKIHARNNGEMCEIIVEDNGMGFDEKHVDRVFKPFQRLHGRTEYEGTGMGLAICRKIVDRHGGIITVRPVPGKGTRFIINLPIRQERRDAGPLGLTSRPRPPDPAT